jgi:type II secretory pathway component PulL
LQITALPYAELSESGTSLGRVTVENIMLSAGRHALRLVHPEYEPLNRVVNVPEGKTVRLTIDWAEIGIRRKTP